MHACFPLRLAGYAASSSIENLVEDKRDPTPLVVTLQIDAIWLLKPLLAPQLLRCVCWGVGVGTSWGFTEDWQFGHAC